MCTSRELENGAKNENPEKRSWNNEIDSCSVHMSGLPASSLLANSDEDSWLYMCTTFRAAVFSFMFSLKKTIDTGSNENRFIWIIVS